MCERNVIPGQLPLDSRFRGNDGYGRVAHVEMAMRY